MNILLWVLQVLLAVAFLAHGWMFLFPPEDMAFGGVLRPDLRRDHSSALDIYLNVMYLDIKVNRINRMEGVVKVWHRY